ncbi:ShlB/FhaC/HecB family hemolysin secretion/activation protein [Pseudothauera nasutitermitis]|uniref:ShlB/FhaC/HecB family hemolysin secretion/activation protein n=1 Tax=Pseudothauera nasutitermitis TaxID=2565930 RepID=A0A4S4B182_9RHOO|nr:ShlB/FhaC/HecB family hemolysin secretion/activation protein [Pseudothauera nasutitermitis]THF66296.1 ShlB/FhaC/HecB family hemolysin secretion/activation protein [Pseudothauera nasutitermitis]
MAALAGFASSLHAQSLLPGDLDLNRERQERLLQEQQRRLQELRELPGVMPAPAEKPAEPGKCFDIQRIELQGSTLLDGEERRRLVEPFEGRCLAVDDLNELLRRITAWYLDRGYVTSRAYLAEQDLSSGTLEVIVVEGQLERIEPGPDSGLSVRELNLAFPGQEGERLNLRELEQLVDQLNRLPSNRATVELIPGEAVGGSRAVIANQPEKPWRLSFTRHNDGQRSTGRQQWAVGLELDSPLGLADQLMVRGGADTHGGKNPSSDNGFFHYGLPWGWWTFSYTYSQSHYRSINETSGFAFALTGQSRSHELRAERLLHRDAVGKTAVNFAIGQVDSRNYIEGSLLKVSSPRLSEAGLGLNHGRRIGSAFVNLDLGWQRGIGAFGGLTDRHPASGEPHAQYDKYTFTASFLQPFALAGQAFTFDSLVFAQKSEDVLYGPRRISIGGLGSVRGFQDQSLSGDSGGYWRNQLRWRTPVAPDALGAAAAAWLPAVLGEFGVTLAWDVGVIARDRHNKPAGQHGRISGRAIELSARGKHLRASLTYAQSLVRPDVLPAGEHPLHLRVELLL